MTERDPFPMRSKEAAALAASVAEDPSPADGEGNTSSWNRMGTSTSVDPPSKATSSEGELGDIDAKGKLVGGSKRSKKKKGAEGETSIYDEDEMNSGGGRNGDEDDEDDFLNQPLGTSPLEDALPPQGRRMLNATTRGFGRVYRRLYGDSIPPSEMLRTLCLSSTLFFMIGGYWLLRSLKDPVLTALCGVTVIPKAKMLSVFVVLGVVAIYNRLLDSDTPKHRLFYVFGSFYFVLFSTIAVLLSDETIGLPNQEPDPARILGWISYCSIESFGSVMVSLFWSFANSNFSLESAKASYGFMVATAQVGSIIGPTIVNQFGGSLGLPKCYFIGALCMLFLQGSIYLYVSVYGASDVKKDEGSPKKKKEKAGILEGLKLFAQHNYVKGIFAISCLFMVEVTIVDYTMKVLARDHFASLHPCERGQSCWNAGEDEPSGMSEMATAEFMRFMGLFGQATNTLSFFLSLLGTSAVIRTLGLRLTLLLFPSICLGTIIMVRLNPTLYTVFAAMMILKASSYALNNPTKEILYQPTSSSVRYKAKSWIDIFGARGSKALGSVVTNAFSDSASTLISNGSLVGMGVASFLIWNARFMGKKFDEYNESGYIVGGENTDDGEKDGAGNGIEMAENQNEGEGTSCAIYDDDEIGEVEEGQSDDSDEGGKDEEGNNADSGDNKDGKLSEVIMV
uniref:ADP,ATP carrier protein n=1 Tax=Helicotheca tamesis TaxID=374047 RepID=A0A7S2GZ17_9STRA|mmetsp:Transcript_13563/g.18608  ORF Transcript_13563/g.18608 Transcript_13563/m.18608 type:complete len:680 (+) Transcript_13563:182-2221(+)|eukprot:CAMPEP_0185738872 /NCGR_PEP_ID=MMETSP1171-20130828/34108_1 /TAXON_ID=374046 /ORGANISM="Helicotheca tamensis, Strain CCMP826" /LENGTH=679 /DNA_ID=CAMNT_0028410257 /DNA_START=127 /DNA_END=2166 /DNA_ORIENTATION=+